MEARAQRYLQDLGLSEEQLRGWTVQVAQRAGEDVGLVVTLGPEIHIVSIIGKRAMSRRNTIEFIAPLLGRFGYVTTRVPIGETDHRLRELLGFKETWTDERFRYFALTSLPFKKE